MMEKYLIRILMMVIFVVLAPVLGGLLDGIDRKISARMQGRKGPSILQPFYDVKKLMNKQLLSFNRFQLLMIMTYMVFVVFSGALFFGGCDMLLCLFSLSTAEMFLILAAASTHSPFSTIGAQREMVQMMAYEPMLLLTAVGFYLASGSFNVMDVLQMKYPAVIYIPGFFLGFIFILTIKFRKSPFDISTSHHAHQEVVKGLTTEMCGIEYAATTVAEWYENVFLLAIVGAFFVTSNPWSYLGAVVVVLLVYFVEILIDNTSARVSWQMMLKSAWGVTVITAGLNLLILQMIR